MSLLGQLSDLGDTTNALGCAGVLAIWCWRMVNRLTAAVFLTSLGVLLATVIALKFVSASYAAAPEQTPMLTLSTGAPSGHAALAAFVYGSAALLCRRAGRGRLAELAPLLFLAVIGTVAVTRVTLSFHTAADVLAGLAVGAASLAVFDRVLRAQAVRPTGSVPALLSGLLVVAAAITISGVRLPSTLLI